MVIGYLGAGVVIGPFTPGFTVDRGSIELLADIGVAFLMFAVGAEFSRQELRRLGRIGGVGGALQLALTMGMGTLVGTFVMGSSPFQGVFLGALLALSSTVVALKVLTTRGELDSPQGRAALGILIAQDLAVVPMVVVLPQLGSGSGLHLSQLGITIGAAIVVLIGGYVLGSRLAPRILRRVAIPRTRELFLLGVVTLALGAALLTEAIGLSFAFGAFLAGIVLAESEFRTQVVAEVLPLRDLFTSLFFVSVGMLINPTLFVADPGLIVLLAAVVIAGKAVVSTAALRAVRVPGQVALSAGLALAQVGEFSFVLARIGVSTGAIPQRFFDLILATSVVSVIASPFLLTAASPLSRALNATPLLGRAFRAPTPSGDESAGLRRHTVVCGYGRVGRELADALERRRLPYLVIEYNLQSIGVLRRKGVPAIYGDASNPAVLAQARLEQARLLAVVLPRGRSVELAVSHARRINPDLPVVARAADADQVARLQQAGVHGVVQPEFEAGVEVIRHAMQHFGVFGPELDLMASGRRAAFYRAADQDAAT